MLEKEMSGNTTLMALAETPRVLVLALVTGVGALVAPDGAATPSAIVLPKKAMVPPVLSSLRLALDLPQRRIAISPSAAFEPALPGEGYRSLVEACIQNLVP